MKQHAIRNTIYAIRHRSHRTAFTLIELLIVVAILGILAAVTLPTIQGHIIDAKEAAAKDTLRTFREAIERYANDHGGIAPGYIDDTLRTESFLVMGQLAFCSDLDGRFGGKIPTSEYKYGPYLNDVAIINPFNRESVLILVSVFPETPDGMYGWLYNPDTKEIRINWPGKDSKGVRYFDY